MALAHKELEVESIPWHFTEKEAISFSGQERVPVLVNGKNSISDSRGIAKNLETEGISVEVIDPRTLTPLDRETIGKSVLKTKRLIVADPGWHSFGAASEIISSVSEKNIHEMKASPIRITLPDSHTPMSAPLEKKYYIKQENIVSAVKKLMKQKK